MSGMSLGMSALTEELELVLSAKIKNEEELHRCPNADLAACEFCKLLNVFSIVSRNFKLR